MPRGTWSRLLLCLLMLWQLGASVLAHPIEGVQSAPPAAEAPCHEHDMQGMSDDGRSAEETAAADAEHQQAPAHGCKSACKCACANTPALSFVLAQNAPVTPGIRVSPQPLYGIDTFSPARLLRPPI